MSGKAYLVVALVCLSVYTTQGKLYICPSVSSFVYFFAERDIGDIRLFYDTSLKFYNNAFFLFVGLITLGALVNFD